MPEYQSPYMALYQRRRGTGRVYDSGISHRFERVSYQFEQRLLRRLYGHYFGDRRVRLLDYACGTGRITAVFEGLAAEKVGMDASGYQLHEARSKGIDATFMEGNIVTEPQLLGDREFDLVTSFRLFLNLEPGNRVRILRQLRRVLRDDGYLLVDNHMNRYSVLGLMALFLKKVLRVPEKAKAKPGRRGIIGTMSEFEFRRALREAGFSVVAVHRFWLLPGHRELIALPERALLAVEGVLSRIPGLNLLSKNQVYICRKQGAT